MRAATQGRRPRRQAGPAATSSPSRSPTRCGTTPNAGGRIRTQPRPGRPRHSTQDRPAASRPGRGGHQPLLPGDIVAAADPRQDALPRRYPAGHRRPGAGSHRIRPLPPAQTDSPRASPPTAVLSVPRAGRPGLARPGQVATVAAEAGRNRPQLSFRDGRARCSAPAGARPPREPGYHASLSAAGESRRCHEWGRCGSPAIIPSGSTIIVARSGRIRADEPAVLPGHPAVRGCGPADLTQAWLTVTAPGNGPAAPGITEVTGNPGARCWRAARQPGPRRSR